jgi:DNA polymerase (family X)
MNLLVKKADVVRAMAAARGAAMARHAPLLSREDAVVELSRVPGVGAARAGVLYDQLGICTLAELQQAVTDGRVAEVRGFGPAAVDRIRAALDRLMEPHSCMAIGDAEVHVQRVLAYLQQGPAVQMVEAAGSYRRRCDVVEAIIILAVSTRPAAVIRYFCAYADAVTSTAIDPSRGAITLECGLKVELRVVPGRCHGAALHHLTGSVDYEAAVRALGLEHGVRVSDYGVFLLEAGKAGARRVGGQREEDVFAALGMQWIPPELRENDGEIEAAQRQALPGLVTRPDIRGDLRLRTRRTTGTASLGEMLRGCRALRYSYCAIAEPFGAAAPHGLDAAALREQAEELAALRSRYPALHILHGAEVAIAPDGLLEIDGTDAALLDLVIAAVHTRPRTSRSRATERLLRVIEDPRVDILAYPSGRVIGERDRMDADYDEVFRAAASHGVAIELSAEPRRLDPPRDLLRRAAAAGALVVINTAAGSAATLDLMRFGVDQARRGWLEAENVLNTRGWDGLRHFLG